MTQVVLFGDSGMRFARPLSIYKLASQLRSHGISCQTIWAWNSVSPADFYNLCRKFLSSKTLVVGISTTLLNKQQNFWGVPEYQAEVRFQLIKHLAPNAKLVAGGSQIVEMPVESIPLNQFVDIFVTGQGENSLLSIAQAQQQGARIKTMQLSPALVTQELYPYNDFVTSTTEFDSVDCVIPGEAQGYEFARGCIFKCSFCAYELTGKNRNDYNKSVDTIYQELQRNYNEFGISHYNIVDDLLNDSEEKVNAILEVAERLPFQLTYSAFVRLDMLRRFPSMATKLKQSGLIGCFMGIETVNDASGRTVGKGLGRARINEALAVLNDTWRNQVVVEAGFILGLPHDTPDTKYDLLEWLQEPLTKATIKYPNFTSLNINNYKKVSDIDKNPPAFGYQTQDNVNWTLGNYSKAQASKDVYWLREQYYADRKYNSYPRVEVFTLPYLLSITNCRDDIMDVVLNDHSTVWPDRESWMTWTEQQYTKHRQRYVDLLLER